MSTSNKSDSLHDPEDSLELMARQPNATAAKQQKAPSPRNCRNFARKETADAMPEIVTTFVCKAKQGSVPHFTFLAKFGGFEQKPVTSEAPKRRRKTLARQLLDEVEKYEAKQAAELAAANAGTSQIDDPEFYNPNPQERS